MLILIGDTGIKSNAPAVILFSTFLLCSFLPFKLSISWAYKSSCFSWCGLGFLMVGHLPLAQIRLPLPVPAANNRHWST